MKYNRPIYVDDVATNFPDLKVVMCHGGFPWVDEFLCVAHSNPNIWVDISFMDYLERTFRRPGLTEETLRSLAALVGAERLLWGTEGPYMDLPLYGQHGPENYAQSRRSSSCGDSIFSARSRKTPFSVATPLNLLGLS